MDPIAREDRVTDGIMVAHRLAQLRLEAEVKFPSSYRPFRFSANRATPVHSGGSSDDSSIKLQNDEHERVYSEILDQYRRYPEITCPVEIVHGEADIIVPPQIHAIPLSNILPDARLTLLPGVGHMPHHARPNDVVAALDRLAAAAR